MFYVNLFFMSENSIAVNLVLLGTEKIRIAIEAGVRTGWDRFIGMTGFGASAPAEVLNKHFGITAAAVVKAAMK